ncbi:hypothetical protein LJB42_003435 [Komagataella kurtzmanii]|nr:hypothetical protein LJB42_003435 [Komagataella kurtzmanii]
MATQFVIDLGIKEEETYSISNKSLKFDTPDDISPYLEELNKIPHLKKIDFSGNTIGVDPSKLLAEALLKHAETIVEVNFADFFTGRLKDEIPRSLGYLLPALLECHKLRVLNLSDNAFGLQTIDPIESFLAQAVSLEHLILSNNGMGPYAGSRIGKSLYKLSVAKSKTQNAPDSLKTFYCGRNRLESGSVNYLAIGLRAHKNLESVRLYQNGIRPAGVSKLILQGLKANTELKVFDLQDNTFTFKGAKALSVSLPSWSSLKEINVNDCLLNPKGSFEFAKALKEGDVSKELEVLKLQYNELEANSLELLVESIDKFPNLKVLELNGNRFEEDSALIEKLSLIFEERGTGELDELDDLEEVDSEEEDEEEEEEETDNEEDDTDLDQLQEKLDREIAGVEITKGDEVVDELAEELKKSSINQ